MTSTVDPLRPVDADQPVPTPLEDVPTTTLQLLEQWRARLASGQSGPTAGDIARVDRAIATIRSLQDETEGLRKALTSRATIDQAKGMIMADRRCDADAAFQVLVKMSTDTNVPLRDVARALVYQAVRG